MSDLDQPQPPTPSEEPKSYIQLAPVHLVAIRRFVRNDDLASAKAYLRTLIIQHNLADHTVDPNAQIDIPDEIIHALAARAIHERPFILADRYILVAARRPSVASLMESFAAKEEEPHGNLT